jgi:hypothetical protein
MTWRNYLFLFLIGVFLLLPVAYLQSAPGYMDADYYFAGGLRLAGGYGFSEMILWNFLDDPDGLPHPSHAYWLPLASIISASGMVITGKHTFAAGQIGFLVIAGLIPPTTAALSYMLTHRKKFALLAGFLAAIPGFYLSYLSTTDTFGVYMLLGGLWLLVAGYRFGNENQQLNWGQSVFQPVLLGLISGFMHLARSDGLIWLTLGFFVCVWPAKEKAGMRRSPKAVIQRLIIFSFAYLIVMGPWMLRSLSSFGTLLTPGGFQVLWITDYNELYSYPASILTPARWLALGIDSILRSRLHALGQNLQTAVAVQGEIFLVPLIVMGLWRLRKDYRVRLGIIAWLITFFAMTFIFPDIGWRGGFFHSGTSVQTLFWAVVPVGLEAFIHWGVRVRHWHPTQSRNFFSVGLIGLAIMLSGIVAMSRVIGADLSDPQWGKSEIAYKRLELALFENGAEHGDVVLVNNAPGYYVATGRPAISIPNGDEHTTLAVARRYGGRYLLLENNHPEGLNKIYGSPGDRPGLKYVSIVDGTHIYQITP